MDWWGLATLLISVAAALLNITLHELSHGVAAWRLGDPTAKNAGRLTLNPIKHLDPVGLIMMIYRFAPLNHASLLGLCVLSNLALLGTGMGLFNLIPISPLDGSKILFALLPDRIYHTILRYERYVMIVMILLVVSGVFDTPLSFLMTHVLQLFCSATGMSLDWLLVSRNASVILNLL